eukprot:1971062-Pyramimonas_sp.AAC.1
MRRVHIYSRKISRIPPASAKAVEKTANRMRIRRMCGHQHRLLEDDPRVGQVPVPLVELGKRHPQAVGLAHCLQDVHRLHRLREGDDLTLRATVWTLRATVWTLRAKLWTLRATVWTLRATVWTLRGCPYLPRGLALEQLHALVPLVHVVRVLPQHHARHLKEDRNPLRCVNKSDNKSDLCHACTLCGFLRLIGPS